MMVRLKLNMKYMLCILEDYYGYPIEKMGCFEFTGMPAESPYWLSFRFLNCPSCYTLRVSRDMEMVNESFHSDIWFDSEHTSGVLIHHEEIPFLFFSSLPDVFEYIENLKDLEVSDV